jgi:hypothetical protein
VSKHDLQARPVTTTNANRSKPTSRSCSPHYGQSLDRAPNGLEHQEARPDRTPLPDGENPWWKQILPPTRYPTTSAKLSARSIHPFGVHLAWSATLFGALR